MDSSVLAALIVAGITVATNVAAVALSHFRVSVKVDKVDSKVGQVEKAVNGNTERLQRRIAKLEKQLNDLYAAQVPSDDVEGHAWAY